MCCNSLFIFARRSVFIFPLPTLQAQRKETKKSRKLLEKVIFYDGFLLRLFMVIQHNNDCFDASSVTEELPCSELSLHVFKVDFHPPSLIVFFFVFCFILFFLTKFDEGVRPGYCGDLLSVLLVKLCLQVF